MGICPCFRRKKHNKKKIIPCSLMMMNTEEEADTDFKQNALAATISTTPHLTDKHHSYSERSSVNLTTLEPRLKCSISLDSSPTAKSDPTFTYRELAAATHNFRSECLIGEGGFGSVYKGNIERTGQVVAVKKLDTLGLQGSREFLVEVLMLSLLHHPNLVNLVGYCAEGDQRLLVYEFLPLGSLEYHLHDLPSDKKPLDWNNRMKIAAGVAEGLNYLHNQADPAVIYRDLKSSNVLLDEGFLPKLSDFGLAKFGPPEDKSHVSTRVMGTEGYCAPEYYDTGKLTAKSDVYCFGILLLEIISGHRPRDTYREQKKRTLLEWAYPLLKDCNNFGKIVDERLGGKFSESGLHLAIDVALRCLQEIPLSRPSMEDISSAMKLLASRRLRHIAAHGSGGDGVNGSRKKGEAGNSTGLSLKAAEDGSKEAKQSGRDDERERAVAEAKLWGETWRAKMQSSCEQSEMQKSNH